MTRDLGRIAKLLSATFPELGDVWALSRLGEGYRCLVVETPDAQVFKVAKGWEASAGFAKERHLLPQIRDLLPSPIPYPVWHAGSSVQFPFGVLGYPKLPGQPLRPSMVSASKNEIACGVAAFLVALHGISRDDFSESVLPTPRSRWHDLERLRDQILPTLRELLTPDEYRAVNSWWTAFLTDPRMRQFTPVLQHGDLWCENILTDDGATAITGIIDFENAAVGDPAQDFATQLHLGRDFTEAVLEHYQTAGGILDGDIRYRIQRLWELREFHGMGSAIWFEDQIEFDDALRKLRRGPILDATTRRDTAIWQPPAG